MFARTVIFIFVLSVGMVPWAQEPVSPPLPPSPIEQFRQWLEMPVAERERQLSEWPEPNQTVLRAKLESYARLKPEERERRLAMLDLRYYLGPLLDVSRTPDREAQVAAIPDKYREIVRLRLQEWDQLPAEVKARMKENDLALQYLTRIRRPPSQPPLPPLNGGMEDGIRRRLEAWQQTSAEEKRALSFRLNRYFQLPREERQKTLRTLSEEEREEIQRSLEALNRMSPAQRQACIQSFAKLANMSRQEQMLFLRNAARWQAMTQEERETWKKLVLNLPPLPPTEQLPPIPSSEPLVPPTAAITNDSRP